MDYVGGCPVASQSTGTQSICTMSKSHCFSQPRKINQSCWRCWESSSAVPTGMAKNCLWVGKAE
eukprot:scaffold212977_cov12-Tisochrysis_lutea.AAC.1